MSVSKYLSPPSFLTSEHFESPPLSPSSISSNDSPLSPSSTSSNDSPFVESPPSSLGHEHDLDKCPADNEPPSPYALSKAPYFDMRPSLEKLETCRPVLGFPIPDEWLPHRYELKKATGAELQSYGKESSMAFNQLGHICDEVCDEMWPEGRLRIGATSVWYVRDGETKICPLLQIGSCTLSPSFDVAMEMADRLLECGIGEMPDWYPECEKF